MFNKCELLLIITIIDYDCDCRGRVSLEEGVRVQEGRRMGTEFTFHLDYDPEKGRKCFFSFLFFSFFFCPNPSTHSPAYHVEQWVEYMEIYTTDAQLSCL